MENKKHYNRLVQPDYSEIINKETYESLSRANNNLTQVEFIKVLNESGSIIQNILMNKLFVVEDKYDAESQFKINKKVLESQEFISNNGWLNLRYAFTSLIDYQIENVDGDINQSSIFDTLKYKANISIGEGSIDIDKFDPQDLVELLPAETKFYLYKSGIVGLIQRYEVGLTSYIQERLIIIEEVLKAYAVEFDIINKKLKKKMNQFRKAKDLSGEDFFVENGKVRTIAKGEGTPIITKYEPSPVRDFIEKFDGSSVLSHDSFAKDANGNIIVKEVFNPDYTEGDGSISEKINEIETNLDTKVNTVDSIDYDGKTYFSTIENTGRKVILGVSETTEDNRIAQVTLDKNYVKLSHIESDKTETNLQFLRPEGIYVNKDTYDPLYKVDGMEPLATINETALKATFKDNLRVNDVNWKDKLTKEEIKDAKINGNDYELHVQYNANPNSISNEIAIHGISKDGDTTKNFRRELTNNTYSSQIKATYRENETSPGVFEINKPVEVIDDDALATKAYVDNHSGGGGSALFGDGTPTNTQSTKAETLIDNFQAIAKSYVDVKVSRSVKKEEVSDSGSKTKIIHNGDHIFFNKVKPDNSVVQFGMTEDYINIIGIDNTGFKQSYQIFRPNAVSVNKALYDIDYKEIEGYELLTPKSYVDGVANTKLDNKIVGLPLEGSFMYGSNGSPHIQALNKDTNKLNAFHMGETQLQSYGYDLATGEKSQPTIISEFDITTKGYIDKKIEEVNKDRINHFVNSGLYRDIDTEWDFIQRIYGGYKGNSVEVHAEATRTDGSFDGRDRNIWDFNGTTGQLEIWREFNYDGMSYTEDEDVEIVSDRALTTKKYVDEQDNILASEKTVILNDGKERTYNGFTTLWDYEKEIIVDQQTGNYQTRLQTFPHDETLWAEHRFGMIIEVSGSSGQIGLEYLSGWNGSWYDNDTRGKLNDWSALTSWGHFDKDMFTYDSDTNLISIVPEFSGKDSVKKISKMLGKDPKYSYLIHDNDLALNNVGYKDFGITRILTDDETIENGSIWMRLKLTNTPDNSSIKGEVTLQEADINGNWTTYIGGGDTSVMTRLASDQRYTLKADNEALKTRIESLEARLAALEGK